MPDKIIVALGTNQYGSETMTDVEEYYLNNLYPNCLGAETYGRNLVEVIRRLGW